jgi:hypothetical protein
MSLIAKGMTHKQAKLSTQILIHLPMLAGGTLADKPPSPLEPWATSAQVVTLAEPIAVDAIGSETGKTW